MFTGIVEERASVENLIGTRLRIASNNANEDRLGDSVAVNGVCLTVAEEEAGVLGFDLADETLERTTLGDLRRGDPVNLERPVRAADRLGGHIVQGHVDGVVDVLAVEQAVEGARLRARIPEELARYVVEKGSIALDGVSLTVAAKKGDEVEVALVPHTLDNTTLGVLSPGDRMNVEVDVLAKYVESLMRREP